MRPIMTTKSFPAGDYRYTPGVFQYSAGVAAAPGYEIVRVRFVSPVPLAEGFTRIGKYIGDAGRPLTAFCACELRSPAPFTDDGFRSFNEAYVVTLKEWGLLETFSNPVARSNVCPQIAPPATPSFHAFCFTVPASDPAPTFAISGSGEAREGGATYRDRTVRYGDVSPSGLKEKAQFVLGEMERRMALLGFGWADTTATQVYTVHDLHPFLADEIIQRGAAPAGLTWHFNRPPVQGLEFEMDCRGVRTERVIGT
jgi:hypothetical protein